MLSMFNLGREPYINEVCIFWGVMDPLPLDYYRLLRAVYNQRNLPNYGRPLFSCESQSPLAPRVVVKRHLWSLPWSHFSTLLS